MPLFSMSCRGTACYRLESIIGWAIMWSKISERRLYVLLCERYFLDVVLEMLSPLCSRVSPSGVWV